MNRLSVSLLVLGLVAATGVVSAQSVGQPYYGPGYGQQQGYGQPSPDRYGQGAGAQYDYARVVRVDPVLGSRYGTQPVNGQRCYENQTYVSGNDDYGNGYGRNEGYRSDGYRNDGYRSDGYRGDGYRSDGYARDGYYDPYGGNRSSGGSQAGGTIATVIGGVVGAVIGSQVGGGSARYATSAIGSMVGGVAGRQIYEQSQRQRDRTGSVRVCDPVRVDGRYPSSSYGSSNGYASNDRAVSAYDVTYEYAGRSYSTRTSYHPGDRIRVRVDVRPE